MLQPTKGRTVVFAMFLTMLFAAAGATAANVPTVRVDYYHTGDAVSETFSLHQVVIEPLPWPGHPDQPIDTLRRGHFLFQVEDPETGAVLYSRGYSSIFQEWQHTGEAREMTRTFHESVRFPKPDRPVRLRVLKRNAEQVFESAWAVSVDTDDMLVARAHPPAPAPVIDLHVSGDPARKVDVAVLGDGYSAAEADKFEADARRLVEVFFAYEPYASRADDFNFRGIAPPAPESGVNRPSNGTFRYSPSGTTYDAFRSERYVLAFDNLGMRRILQHLPYEFVIVLANSNTYGGGGIYGLYSTAAADSAWAGYLVVHEFGHHFAALADEYYTSDAVYEAQSERTEPWEPNVTALHDPNRLKWRARVAEGTPLPTPWPKDAFEAFQRDNQAERARLRAEQRPEAEMDALFRREQAFVEDLFAAYPATNNVIGAFEGANYAATGYFRSEMNCTMFTRHDRFCRVCRDAIEEVIDLYSDAP
ncbi:MAG: M64 family metallopeptidase [Xanthomonadales bacterium]